MVSYFFIAILFLVILVVALAITGLYVLKEQSWFVLLVVAGVVFAIPVTLSFKVDTVRQNNARVGEVHQREIEAIAQEKTATARRTAVLTRIELLEKELEAKSKRIQGLSNKKQEERAGSQESKEPKRTELIDEKLKKEIQHKQIEEAQQLLKNAKQELQKETNDLAGMPQWLEKETVIEQNSLQETLADPLALPDRFVISSGRFTTRQEAQDDSSRMARQVVEARLQAQTKLDSLRLDEHQMRLLIINNESQSVDVQILNGSATKMYREHLLVDIGPEYLKPIIPGLREIIVEKRIFGTAGGLLVVMLLCGLLSFILSGGRESQEI